MGLICFLAAVIKLTIGLLGGRGGIQLPSSVMDLSIQDSLWFVSSLITFLTQLCTFQHAVVLLNRFSLEVKV